MQRQGLYPAPPGWPRDIPGLEMAGEVVSVGPRVTRFAPGDRVVALVGGGAQATLATVDEAHALAVPASLPWPQAGGLAEVFATAFDALFGQARLTLGERLLVTGAAGGVGSDAKLQVDLLQLMSRRARLFASTLRARSRDEKAALVAALGAHALPLLASGRLRVPVSETFRLREAATAYERFAGDGKLGKIVLIA